MRGVTVCTPIDAGLAGADDADHLAWCAKNEWVLVTHNISDFWALHTDLLAGGDGHSGLVLNPTADARDRRKASEAVKAIGSALG
jgi:hypothetical protein